MRRLIATILVISCFPIAAAQVGQVTCDQLINVGYNTASRATEEIENFTEDDGESKLLSLRLLYDILEYVVEGCDNKIIASVMYDAEVGQLVFLPKGEYLVEITAAKPEVIAGALVADEFDALPPDAIMVRLEPSDGSDCEPVSILSDFELGDNKAWSLLEFNIGCEYIGRVFAEEVDDWSVIFRRLSD